MTLGLPPSAKFPCWIFRNRIVLLGVLLFLFALIFYYLAVLRLDYYKTSFLDLGPYPDAVEYFAQANSVLRYGAPTIQIGYDRLPSRYPPGYPILMIPWLKLLPEHEIILAPFRTNETIGLLLLIAGFGFYLRIGKSLSGGLATLLLSTQPAFVTYSRSSISDLSGAAAVLLAFALVYLGLASRRRWPIYCSAVVLGLSLSIKPHLVFFAPLLISMALFPRSESRAKWLLHCAAVIIAFALAASPYFILNTLEFGHPLKTGYDFWVPAFTDNGMPFSVHNVPRHLTVIRSELTLHRDQFGVANLFGTGTYFVPTFMLLALVGLPFLKLSRFVISGLLAGTIFLAATATYSFADGRFYMPIQFLLVPLAVLPVQWAMTNYRHTHYSFLSIAILVVFVLSCLGYPSQSGFKPRNGRFQAWDAFEYPNGHGKSRCYNTQKEFSRSFNSKPGVVLSDIDPVYLNTLLPKGFVAAPLDGNHSYCYSRKWRYGSPEAAHLVHLAVSHQDPVYALLAASPRTLRLAPRPEASITRLPAIDGYRWRAAGSAGAKTVVMVLVKNPATSDRLSARETYLISAITNLPLVNRIVACLSGGRKPWSVNPEGCRHVDGQFSVLLLGQLERPRPADPTIQDYFTPLRALR